MATQAHCAYCFETLGAHFDKRQALSLSQVEDLWEQYNSADGRIPTEDESSDVKGAGIDGEGVGDVEEMTDAEIDAPKPAKPAAISRLLHREGNARSTRSAGSNSSSSSLYSASSSTKSGDGSTPASSKSSLSTSSSLFSFGRKRQHEHEAHPLFVTWNTHSARNGYKSLRGCIGTFEAQPLEHGLRSYALTSAFEDVRFSPIPASLLPSLSNHVTLLTDFSEPVRDPLDWTLGTHGIRISFSHSGRRYGATYLPDVAKEQGWTKEETLISLMRKAGWNGSSSSWTRVWRDGRGELVRYQGKQVGLNYDEWREWRDWVDKAGVKSSALN